MCNLKVGGQIGLRKFRVGQDANESAIYMHSR